MCTYLTRREGGMYCFRRPVPKDLRGVIGQREWSQSLKTKDRREAEPLALALALETCQIIKEARERLAGVTHPAALEGSPARSPAPSGAMSEPEVEAAAFQAEDTAESEARWELRQEARDLLRERMKISTRELSPSEAAIKDLLRERDFDLALAGDRLLSARVELDALRRTARSADISAGAASGDASPTGTEPPVKLMPLFDGYVAEVQPTASTVTSWRPYIRHLAAFLGHDDASRITTADLRRWKERLQTEEIAPGRVRKPRTIKDGHIAAIKVVLGWAEENGKLPSNPAIGVKIRVPKVAKVRDRGFTNEEAETILAASLHPVEGRMAEGYKLARRWVPWLCAYTGARVNEIGQLRAEDVTQIAGIWTIRITPEAGQVKNKTYRVVPLHPHLIEMGAVAALTAKRAGHIFYDPDAAKGEEANERHHKKVGEKLAAWVRSIGVTDKAIAPNHAWRHRWKDQARIYRVEEEARNVIPGHAAATQGDKYGGSPETVIWLAAEIAKLPRYVVPGLPKATDAG